MTTSSDWGGGEGGRECRVQVGRKGEGDGGCKG